MQSFDLIKTGGLFNKVDKDIDTDLLKPVYLRTKIAMEYS